MTPTNRPATTMNMFSRRSRSRCRLVNWRLENFKSVLDQEISLTPLTVLVGANSSGKSSLIQSILFMAQNAQSSQNEDEARDSGRGYLKLNGDLVELGTFREVLNDSISNGPIGIGGRIEITNPNPNFSSKWEQRTRAGNSDEQPVLDGEVSSLDWSLAFAEPIDSNPLSGVVISEEARALFSVQGEKIQSIKSFSGAWPSNLLTTRGTTYEYNLDQSGVVSTFADLAGDRRGLSIFLADEEKFDAVYFTLGIPTTGLVAKSKFEVFIKQQDFAFTDQPMKMRLFETLKQILSVHRTPHSVSSAADEALPRLGINSRGIFRPSMRREWTCLEGHNFENNRSVPVCPFCAGTKDSLEKSQVEPTSVYPRIGFPDVSLAKEQYVSLALEALKGSEGFGSTSDDTRFVNLLIDPLEVGFLFESEFIDKGVNSDDFEVSKDLVPFQQIGLSLEKNGMELNGVIFLELYNQIYRRIENFWFDVKAALVEKTKEMEFAQVLQSPREVSSSGRSLMGREVVPDDLPVGAGVLQFQELLRKVVYLGPLRAAPVDLWQRFQGARSDQMPLGRDGGYLAQKIYENRLSDENEFPLPPCSKHRGDAFVYFKDALEDWMVCLGIGSRVESVLQGHYGYLLTIDGKSLRVMGTGVSQVLPVIALCLLAPQHGVILLEEPELHLHPRIQQKLGNFLLAITESGKQVIVETHSEYLITRLRLIAAQRPESSKLFSFVFTSKVSDWDTESTLFETMKADVTGEIPPWPAGFFDQVTDDIRDLIVSIAKKNLEQD